MGNRTRPKGTTVLTLALVMIALVMGSIMAIVSQNAPVQAAETATVSRSDNYYHDGWVYPTLKVNGERAWCYEFLKNWPSNGEVYNNPRPAPDSLCYCLYYGLGGPADKGRIPNNCSMSQCVWALAGYYGSTHNGGLLFDGTWEGFYRECLSHAGETGPWNNYAQIWHNTSGHQDLVVCGQAAGKLKVTKVAQPGPGADIAGTFSLQVTIDGTTTKHSLTARSGHSDSWTSGDIPAGTSYSVSEPSLPDGWSLVGWTGDPRSGKIEAGKTLEIICTNKRDTGYGRVQKASTNKSASGKSIPTANNPNYNFAGIEYTVYYKNNTVASGPLTLGSNGLSNVTAELPASINDDDYYAKETKNNTSTNFTGYFSDTSKWPVKVVKNKTTTWNVTNPPMYGYVTVTKRSASTGNPVKLAGFQFQLKGNKSYNSSITRTATTNANGVAVFADPLPLGDYTITETFAPNPYYKDATPFNISLTQADANGNLTGCVSDTSVSDNSLKNVLKVASAATDNRTKDRQWGYLKAIKKNMATGGTVTKKQFRFVVVKRGADPSKDANILGVALTSQGAAASGTGAAGEAIFMSPGTNTPVALPAVNSLNASDGKYDVYETSVVEPFWITTNTYQVTIEAKGDDGTTQYDVAGGDATATITQNGQPVTSITNQESIAEVKCPDNKTYKNTSVVEIADDQYAFIEIIKKNMELGSNDPTTLKDGFKFKLYDTLQNAEAEANALEEVTTDATGKATFKTQLPVRGTARNDPSQGNTRKKVSSQTSNPTDRNDGIYYVRESQAVVPYNKSNAIYRFTISASGNEGDVSFTVDVKNSSGHNSPYPADFQSYPNGPTGTEVAVHDSTVSGFSGAGVKNICPTTVEDAPQYGRIKIIKSDSEDGTLQRGAEYQVYPANAVTYVNQGENYLGNGNAGNQRTPTAGTDAVSGAKAPTGYTKLKSYDVNQHPDVQGADPTKIQKVANTDVVMTTKLPAGSSSFDATTGAVTVTNPVVFTRADGTTYDTIVTDENGEATTGWLPIDATGTTRYYIVEVKTSNGHVIDGTRFYADLVYDATLQDRECIVATKDTTNIQQRTQTDKPNEIEILKKIKPSPSNPSGGVLGGVTIGLWKDEDDIKVTPQSNDGTYSFDAIVIRTPSNSLVPTVHQRITGTEVHVKGLPDGKEVQLTSASHQVAFSADVAGYTGWVPSGDYDIRIIDSADPETDDEDSETDDSEKDAAISTVEFEGLHKISLKEGDRATIDVTVGQLTEALTVSSSSAAIETRASNLTYDASRDAFIATNLKAGAMYEVEFHRQVVKTIETSSNGGHVWFGRYAEEDGTWFNKGWLDQAALPTSDSRIITNTTMAYDAGDVYTTNTTPLTTGNTALHTTGNQAWLQDTSNGKTYQYGTMTDSNGLITNKRIGAGTYVLAEVKPPVDNQKHTTYLPDTFAHRFSVDDVTGYIKDIDNGRADNLADHHEDGSYVAAPKKGFIFVDDVTKLNLSKYEISGSEELTGAELVLTAMNNDVIDRWISTKEPHYIEGLVPGWYRLTEYATPKNYDKAESVEFNLLPTGEIQHCVMFDKPISIDAEIDKKQEIAKPLGERHEPNGDNKNRADAQLNDNGLYAYSLDFRSNSNTWTDEFTVEDPLEPANQGYAKLVSLITPQAFQDYDGKVNVWYKTNLMANDYRDLSTEPSKDGNEETGTEEKPQEGDGKDDKTDATESETTDSEKDESGASDEDGDPKQDESADDEKETKPSRPATGSVKYVANATLEDGHENPWLYDDNAMAADSDGDGRIIDYTGWKLWKKNLPASVATRLDVSELQLGAGEYVTGFRFEYGRVEVGFTSRTDGWDSEMLHYEHDDVDHITGLSNQSFQAGKSAADAAVARMGILTSRFTTDMSFLLEDDVAREREKARQDYDQQLTDIDAYNARLAELDPGTLPKFAEKLVVPAYADGTDDVQRLDAALEASKASLQASFPLATDPRARELLLITSRQAVADLENVVSQETLNNLNAKIQAYEDEIDRIPSDAGGYDIDHANSELMAAFMAALDDIRTFGLSGRTLYAPAVVHMQLTDMYVPGTTLKNSAKVDAYRNGGNDETEAKIKTTLTNKATGDHAVGSSGVVTVIDKVEYKGLEPGTEYTMSGVLHLRVNGTDGGALIDSGKEVTATKTFTPTSSDGVVELEFTFHAELLDGNSAVAFETCYSTSDESVVLTHKNISDGYQTVNEKGDVDLYENNLEGHDRDEVVQTPRERTEEFIGTRLATVDSQKVVESDGTENVILTDLVDYHNLIPGKKYQMSGVLHVRAYDTDNKTPVDGGTIKGSKGETIFVPEQPDGTVEVKLIMPASEILFKPVVAYEELREVKEGGVASDIIIAEHKDITNEDQTVMVTMLADDEIHAPLIQTGENVAKLLIGSLASVILLGVSRMIGSRRKA